MHAQTKRRGGFLRLAAAARRIGVSTTTLRRWIAAGTFPAYRLGGGFRVDPAELDAWLLEHREGG